MDYTRFDKPWIYDGKWNVFDNTILTNLNLSDCSNTINGFCEHTDNLEQCIKICENAPLKNCTHGYFIETPDNHNYCVPLHTHKNVTFPYHRLRQKDYYPIMNDMTTSFFANKNVFPFPPFNPNMIFYRDIMILKHKESGLNVGTNSDDEMLRENVIFTANSSVYIQFVPKNIERSKVDEYTAVKNGDELVINIPGTAFVLHRTRESKVVWQLGVTTTNSQENVFQIHCPNKNVGEILDYGDEIYFTTFKNLIVYQKELGLVIEQNNDITQNPEGIFSLVPKVEVKYCNKGECTKISLDQADLKGHEAYYNGKRVYRSFCWIDCEEKKRNIFWIVVCIVLVLLFFILYFKKFLVFN
jgi:hypothetical protein